MNLELFAFVKHSTATSSSASPLGSKKMDVANSGNPTTSRSENPTAPPLKRMHFISKWSKEHTWLKHNCGNDTFCEWCHHFDRNELTNLCVKGCASMKLESIMVFGIHFHHVTKGSMTKHKL